MVRYARYLPPLNSRTSGPSAASSLSSERIMTPNSPLANVRLQRLWYRLDGTASPIRASLQEEEERAKTRGQTRSLLEPESG